MSSLPDSPPPTAAKKVAQQARRETHPGIQVRGRGTSPQGPRPGGGSLTKRGGREQIQGTILLIGISTRSEAPALLSRGIRVLISDLETIVSTAL